VDHVRRRTVPRVSEIQRVDHVRRGDVVTDRL
jgi:hypothetical protein